MIPRFSRILALVVEMVPFLVVEIVPTEVVEMVPVLVVEMVPTAVVEMVPAFVVEIVPAFEKAVTETVKIRAAANKINWNFLMVFLQVLENRQGIGPTYGCCCLLSHHFQVGH